MVAKYEFPLESSWISVTVLDRPYCWETAAQAHEIRRTQCLGAKRKKILFLIVSEEREIEQTQEVIELVLHWASRPPRACLWDCWIFMFTPVHVDVMWHLAIWETALEDFCKRSSPTKSSQHLLLSVFLILGKFPFSLPDHSTRSNSEHNYLLVKAKTLSSYRNLKLPKLCYLCEITGRLTFVSQFRKFIFSFYSPNE